MVWCNVALSSARFVWVVSLGLFMLAVGFWGGMVFAIGLRNFGLGCLVV